MKKSIFLIINCLLNSILLFSQVAINTDGSAPANSAMLDVKSSSKGLLPPRMTFTELNGISSPENGLIVYCSDCGTSGQGALMLFMAGSWFTLNADCLAPQSTTQASHVPSGTHIVWHWNPALNATGYKWNDVDDSLTATDMGANTSKTETGLVCLTSYTRYVWVYNNCGISSSATLTQSTSGCGWACGDSLTVGHVEGSVAPVSKAVTYGTVINIPGEPANCWITSNLGADHQATAPDDNTEASAGWYWQFNRQQGYKHDGTTRTPNTTWIGTIDENSDWLHENDPCSLLLGAGWRLPTSTEWANVDAAGGWNYSIDAWNSDLRIHKAGLLNDGNSSLEGRGVIGRYWTSSQYNNTIGRIFQSWSENTSIQFTSKATGHNARCLKENIAAGVSY